MANSKSNWLDNRNSSNLKLFSFSYLKTDVMYAEVTNPRIKTTPRRTRQNGNTLVVYMLIGQFPCTP